MEWSEMDKQNFKMVLQSSNESKKKRKSCGADAELKKKKKTNHSFCVLTCQSFKLSEPERH